eukprot:TRINITY_DN94903_c0_g1_i1.p1 TRINITY_DN94903_c0_g1~~TRINITY_DN94903_c0_g1_i1.p1  ORF type:complete len:229 (-),score=45.14 TRINITY_DN94903_c0_g1_i1:9-674(-)
MATELIPFGFESPLFQTSDGAELLRWLEQKDQLGQDIFLVGNAGPLRRWLALHYCATHNREVEYVPLTRDTTESDLKQRREITHGGFSTFTDQAVLVAARKGRVLILEGLDKAERNVLPILNNLLENREMALEDGHFLVHPKRFETLLSQLSLEDLASQKLLKVHPNFRVIAIGLPVPPYRGNPLDPPLRSRFQACRVDQPSRSEERRVGKECRSRWSPYH